MPYTDVAKNAMLDAEHRLVTPTAQITHVGLLTEASKSLTTPFGTASTDLFTSTGHGLSAGNLVVFTALGGGGAGIVIGHPYFVIAAGLTANAFSVSGTPGGAALDFTTDVTGSGTFLLLTEVTGGAPAYARTAIAWNAAGNATIDDSTNGANPLNVPAGTTVSYVMFTSHVSTAISTAGILRGIQDVTNEAFAAQGTYTVTDADGLAPD